MIKFTKMHGLGNDYVYMDAIHQNIEKESSLAQFVSNRNFGIGSDGLILICKSEIADFKMRMFNSDGSEAEICGNAARCLGKLVEMRTGISSCNLVSAKRSYPVTVCEDGRVRVDMGEPDFSSTAFTPCQGCSIG